MAESTGTDADTLLALAAVSLAASEERLKEANAIASARLRAIWNEQTRTYEPREEMVALHDIINKNLAVWNGIARARRSLQTVLQPEGASIERGATMLRLPWIEKEEKR